MAISYVSVSDSGYQTGAATYDWIHTSGGTNRFLAVDVAILSVPGTVVSNVTFSGVSLSFIGAKSTVSGAGRIESWGLKNPPAGDFHIIVTLSAAVAGAGFAVSYGSVDQTTPTEAYNSAQATNVGAADATVDVTPTVSGSWVHAACATDDTSITANQTTRNNITGALGSGADEDTGPIAPAALTTVSYTNVGALATWAIGGYAIRPLVTAPATVLKPQAWL